MMRLPLAKAIYQGNLAFESGDLLLPVIITRCKAAQKHYWRNFQYPNQPVGSLARTLFAAFVVATKLADTFKAWATRKACNWFAMLIKISVVYHPRTGSHLVLHHHHKPI